MKKAFLLLCAALLVLGSVLPLAGYSLAGAALMRAGQTAAQSFPAASARTPDTQSSSTTAAVAEVADADVFLIYDQSTGEVQSVARRDYLIGAVAAEMPISWPDEALKAQAVAAHSYALYCRDHSALENGAWLAADPARRQGWLTDAVLRSYWGTAYEANYARLSAIIDEVEHEIICYDGAAAAASYFALSNGQTEASENVWGSPLPYLVPVESAADRNADNYEYKVTISAAQVRTQLADQLSLMPGDAPSAWFGSPTLTPSGYIATMPVCGQDVSGPTLRRVLGLRSACFTIVYDAAADSFLFTTWGYGHGVGLSQWGAKALAEQGTDHSAILAHYFPGTELAKGVGG